MIKLFLALSFTLLLSGCGGGGSGSPAPRLPPLPPGETQALTLPPSTRRDLYYGYYGCDDASIDEMRDHTNLLVEACWGGNEVAVNRVVRSARATILFVQDELYSAGFPKVYLGDDAVKTNLRTKFDLFKSKGALQHVIALYPCDEPELDASLSDEVVRHSNTILREVMSEYPELSGKPLAVFYGGEERYVAIDTHDWVGFDCYGEDIFASGKLDRMVRQLRPDQRVMLIPGAADPWRNDPTLFYERARTDERVIALVPFLWVDFFGDDKWNLGVGKNGTLPTYRSVGNAIISS